MFKWPIVLLACTLYNTAHCMKTCTEKDAHLLQLIIDKAKTLVESRASKVTYLTNIPIIAIAGCSAVGKTYFAQQLVNLLQAKNVTAKILHLDDFIEPIPVANALLHPQLDHIKAHAVLQAILNGVQNIEKLTWDISGPEPFKKPETFSVSKIDLLIFEGEYTLCGAENYDFFKYSSLDIFMDANDDDIIEWNWNRKRGITEPSKEKFAIQTRKSLQKYRSQIGKVPNNAQYLVTQDQNHIYAITEQSNRNWY